MQRLPLANREDEIDFFAGMVAGTSDERILLLEAGGGIGKTTLLAEFVRRCRAERVPCVLVDLKGDPGLSEVLARLCGWLGWQGFPALMARVEELGRDSKQVVDATRFEHFHRERYNRAAVQAFMVDAFSVDDLRAFCFGRPGFERALHLFTEGVKLTTVVMDLIGFCLRHHGELDKLLVGLREERFELYKRHYADIYGVEEALEQRETAQGAGAGLGRGDIRNALRAADEGSRAARRGALTRALFEDLGAREGRLAILFDTCEQSGPEMEEWLAGPFLTSAQQVMNQVVVIAGRKVPETSPEWEACCQHHPLGNLRDPGLWQKYAEQIGAAIPSKEWVAAFCDLFDGHPLQMMQALARYIPGGGGQ
jgi:hypothetical protein